MIGARDLYYCLLPQCEALCTCRSGFLIATAPKTIIRNALRFRFVKNNTFKFLSLEKLLPIFQHCVVYISLPFHCKIRGFLSKTSFKYSALIPAFARLTPWLDLLLARNPISFSHVYTQMRSIKIAQ